LAIVKENKGQPINAARICCLTETFVK